MVSVYQKNRTRQIGGPTPRTTTESVSAAVPPWTRALAALVFRAAAERVVGDRKGDQFH